MKEPKKEKMVSICIYRTILSIAKIPESVAKTLDEDHDFQNVSVPKITRWLNKHKAWPSRSDSIENKQEFDCCYSTKSRASKSLGPRGKSF